MRIFQYAIIALTLLFATPTFAQENIPISLNGDNSVASTSSREIELTLPKDNLRLGLDWRTSLKVDFPDYWNTYANEPRTTTINIYKGLHGLIYSQLLKTINRYHHKELQTLWYNSRLHPLELQHRISKYHLEASDAGHRWWESRKYFFDHFPIEKGGMRTQANFIGKKIKIFDSSFLTVYNTGKVSVDGWRLEISENKDLPDKKIKKLNERSPPLSPPTKLIEDIKNSRKKVSLGIRPPRGNIYTGESWSLSGKLRISISLDNLNRNSSAIKGGLEFVAYQKRHKHKPWVTVQLKGTAKPMRNEYGMQLLVILLTF